MDLELLRTFLELNRTRHFGRAAEALHFTQAAISSRLKSLESQLGVTLFERSSREMRLTAEGSRLVPHAQRQIAAWRVAKQDVASAGSTEQLVIGGSLHVWDIIVQKWLHDLRRDKPSLAIIAESQSPNHLTRRLIDGTLDVAIMLEPSQLDIMQIKKISSIEFILVSDTKNINIERALQQNYVYVDWGLAHGLDHRRAFPEAPEAMTRVSEARIALEYIRALGGSGYLPKRMVQNELKAKTLHKVKDAPRFTRNVYATYAARSARLGLIRASLEKFQTI